MDTISITINEEYEGYTIKEYLKMNNVGRPKIENIRVSKSSYINGEYKDIEKRLKDGDVLSFVIDENIDFACDDKPLEIVYEDDYLLAVNKPAGMIIHNDDKNTVGALANIVANYYKNKGINRHVRYIHRIDKDTTGIVLFAKDFLTEAILLKQMQENKIEKYYLAYVENRMKDSGTIDYNIGSDRHINGKMCVSKSGKEAHTTYKVIKRFKDYTLVRFGLITGRTHQIRVHSSYIGNPILGDVLYGGNMIYINRVALHFENIRFTHPILCNIIDLHQKMPMDMERLYHD